jgi:hypothetical protein
LLLYRTLVFLYDPLTPGLHDLKKSIIYGAIEQMKTPMLRCTEIKWVAVMMRRFGLTSVVLPL